MGEAHFSEHTGSLHEGQNEEQKGVELTLVKHLILIRNCEDLQRSITVIQSQRVNRDMTYLNNLSEEDGVGGCDCSQQQHEEESCRWELSTTVTPEEVVCVR